MKKRIKRRDATYITTNGEKKDSPESLPFIT